MGCRTVGLAGSQEKISFIVNELGFDAGINYKTGILSDMLADACPLGIDVYFDNVGGPITDAVMEQINTGARISVCGQISQYNLEEPEPGPRNMGALVVSQAKMEGFPGRQVREPVRGSEAPNRRLDQAGQDSIQRGHRGGDRKRAPRVHWHAARRELREAAY